MTEFRIREFEPQKTKEHRVWLIIGPRGSGKTILLNDLLYHTRQRYYLPIAFTATTSSADLFKEILPPNFVYRDGYDYEKADTCLKTAKEMTRREKHKPFLMILDDIAFDPKVFKSETQKEIHLNGRHSKITLFNTTQYCMTLGPLIRSNVDYVICLQDSVLANRKRLYEFFFGFFDTFQQFDTVFKQITNENGALVLDKTCTSANINDSVFYYKARLDLPPFKIGARNFYMFYKVRLKEGKKKLEEGESGRTKIITVDK